MTATMLRVAVVIPTWNGLDLLRACLDALAAQTRAADEIVVVDNGSIDGTDDFLAAGPPTGGALLRPVRLPINRGFAGGVNAGIAATSADVLVLLNNDALPEPGWLAALLEHLSGAPAAVGFVSSKLLAPDGRTIESVGDFLDSSGAPGQIGHGEPDDDRFAAPREVFSGCGAATAYRRTMLTEVGGFDERFFAYYEDVDLCFRARLRGWRGELAPGARVRHQGSVTSDRVPGLKTRLCARNGWWLVVKNVPGRLLPGVLLRLAAGAAFRTARAVGTGGARFHLRGHLEALAGLPGVLADRRSIQRSRTVQVAQVRGWLTPARLPSRLRAKITHPAQVTR
jgi:GT2 family glycosyltransferase